MKSVVHLRNVSNSVLDLIFTFVAGLHSSGLIRLWCINICNLCIHSGSLTRRMVVDDLTGRMFPNIKYSELMTSAEKIKSQFFCVFFMWLVDTVTDFLSWCTCWELMLLQNCCRLQVMVLELLWNRYMQQGLILWQS